MPYLEIFTFATDDKNGTVARATLNEAEAEEWAWDWCSGKVDPDHVIKRRGLPPSDDPDLVLREHLPYWADLYEYVFDPCSTCSVDASQIYISWRRLLRLMWESARGDALAWFSRKKRRRQWP